jgi:hypothetical protein
MVQDGPNISMILKVFHPENWLCTEEQKPFAPQSPSENCAVNHAMTTGESAASKDGTRPSGKSWFGRLAWCCSWCGTMWSLGNDRKVNPWQPPWCNCTDNRYLAISGPCICHGYHWSVTAYGQPNLSLILRKHVAARACSPTTLGFSWARSLMGLKGVRGRNVSLNSCQIAFAAEKRTSAEI